MFYTRIPVPKSTGYSSENLNKATKYFPLVGTVVGSVGAIMFLLAYLFLSVYTAVAISILFMILLTGAFHEDAISDFCDGFGGGYTKMKILEIMKDSQIGTYGGLSLVFLVLMKLLLLSEMDPIKIPLVLIAAHSLSRLNPVVLMYTSQYVREDKTSKSKPIGESKSMMVLIVAFLFAVIPTLFLSYLFLPLILFVMAIVHLYFRHYIHKKVGGYTGDILGTLQQLSEIAFYISFIFFEKVLWTYL